MASVPGTYADFTLSGFTAAVASAEPVPGGGSASAVAAAIGAGLVTMVARLSMDRPKYAAFAATHERALAAGEAARTRFLQLADDDAAAFAQYARALKLPRESDSERTARHEATATAGRAAAAVPLEVVRLCHGTIEHAESLAGRSNLNASSDLDVAALLLHAAARGAGANVLINLEAVPHDGSSAAVLQELHALLFDAEAAAARVHAQVQANALRDPEVA